MIHKLIMGHFDTVDQARLIKKLGQVDRKTAATVLDVLQEMFEP